MGRLLCWLGHHYWWPWYGAHPVPGRQCIRCDKKQHCHIDGWEDYK